MRQSTHGRKTDLQIQNGRRQGEDGLELKLLLLFLKMCVCRKREGTCARVYVRQHMRCLKHIKSKFGKTLTIEIMDKWYRDVLCIILFLLLIVNFKLFPNKNVITNL